VAVIQLQSPAAQRLQFLAGQSVQVKAQATWDTGSSAREGEDFSIASCPCDDRVLELHVRRGQRSALSKRLVQGLAAGDPVWIKGPDGNFVLDADSPRPLVFLACDTGFAPIKSLIEHAMALDVAEHTHLYWIACGAGGHYLNGLCRSWADALDNFRYTPVQAAIDHSETASTGGDALVPRECDAQAVLEQVAADHPKLHEHDFYVAGPEAVTAAAHGFLRAHEVPASQCVFEGI